MQAGDSLVLEPLPREQWQGGTPTVLASMERGGGDTSGGREGAGAARRLAVLAAALPGLAG